MRISEKKMASVFFAILMTNSKLTGSFYIGLKGFTRKQTARSWIHVVVDVRDDRVDQFQELAGVVLEISKFANRKGVKINKVKISKPHDELS